MTRKTPNAERTTATLEALLSAADANTLRELVRALADGEPKIRCASLEFLQKRLPGDSPERADAAAATAIAAWDELETDLADLARYGGGDRDMQDHVGYLIYELARQLERVPLAPDDRRVLVDQVCAYIRGGNTGMDDALYEVAYAASPTDSDHRDLAERFEAMNQDWPCEHARRIYRRIDRERYLELRALKLEYGLDYHDLATFFWEHGEHDKAMSVARIGLEKAKGRMDELRAFVAERALDAGDRAQYLELQFAGAVDGLSPENYREFRDLCSADEWTTYEPRVLAYAAQTRPELRLRIHILRGEFAAAGALLAGMRYPLFAAGGWAEGDPIVQAAATLEGHCPEQVLAYYRTGVPILRSPRERKHYAAIASVLRKVRRVWLDILQQPDAWRAFAREIKFAHPRFPAFHEECAKVLRDW